MSRSKGECPLLQKKRKQEEEEEEEAEGEKDRLLHVRVSASLVRSGSSCDGACNTASQTIAAALADNNNIPIDGEPGTAVQMRRTGCCAYTKGRGHPCHYHTSNRYALVAA